jgi:hypothetical protein
MRRPFSRFSRICPPRFGAVLALVALLVRLLLPSAAAFAADDPLGAVPICTADTAHHARGQGGSHQAAHRACPLCQAPSVAWGFVPAAQNFTIGPRRSVQIVWRHDTIAAAPAPVAGLRARGPPGAA